MRKGDVFRGVRIFANEIDIDKQISTVTDAY